MVAAGVGMEGGGGSWHGSARRVPGRAAVTDALTALGLPPDADARAVKRAYARLLRSVRPDVDPAGFQALHDTYQAALAMSRARQGEGDRADRRPYACAGALDRSDPPAAPDEGQDVVREPGPSHIDVGAFLGALLAQAAGSGRDGLRAWIDAATSGWPITARAVLAPGLLASLDASEVALTPGQFDVIAEAFGFEDVRGSVDPLQVARIKAQTASRAAWLSTSETVTAAREDRGRSRRRGRLSGRLLTALLTGPGVPRRARALRFMPFLSGIVCSHFRDLVEGGGEAAAIGVDTRAAWVRAQARREENEKVYVGAILLAMIVSGLFGLTFILPPPSRATGAPRLPASEISFVVDQVNAASAAVGLGDYARAAALDDKVIARYDTVLPPELEPVVALAYYNRGVALGLSGASERARAAYRELDRAFSASALQQTRLLVACGLNNRALLDLDVGSPSEALEGRTLVVGRYGREGSAAMDHQIDEALLGEVKALNRLGREAEAQAVDAERHRRSAARPQAAKAQNCDITLNF